MRNSLQTATLFLAIGSGGACKESYDTKTPKISEAEHEVSIGIMTTRDGFGKCLEEIAIKAPGESGEIKLEDFFFTRDNGDQVYFKVGKPGEFITLSIFINGKSVQYGSELYDQLEYEGQRKCEAAQNTENVNMPQSDIKKASDWPSLSTRAAFTRCLDNASDTTRGFKSINNGLAQEFTYQLNGNEISLQAGQLGKTEVHTIAAKINGQPTKLTEALTKEAVTECEMAVFMGQRIPE